MSFPSSVSGFNGCMLMYENGKHCGMCNGFFLFDIKWPLFYLFIFIHWLFLETDTRRQYHMTSPHIFGQEKFYIIWQDWQSLHWIFHSLIRKCTLLLHLMFVFPTLLAQLWFLLLQWHPLSAEAWHISTAEYIHVNTFMEDSPFSGAVHGS